MTTLSARIRMRANAQERATRRLIARARTSQDPGLAALGMRMAEDLAARGQMARADADQMALARVRAELVRGWGGSPDLWACERVAAGPSC